MIEDALFNKNPFEEFFNEKELKAIGEIKKIVLNYKCDPSFTNNYFYPLSKLCIEDWKKLWEIYKENPQLVRFPIWGYKIKPFDLAHDALKNRCKSEARDNCINYSNEIESLKNIMEFLVDAGSKFENSVSFADMFPKYLEILISSPKLKLSTTILKDLAIQGIDTCYNCTKQATFYGYSYSIVKILQLLLQQFENDQEELKDLLIHAIQKESKSKVHMMFKAIKKLPVDQEMIRLAENNKLSEKSLQFLKLHLENK